MKTMHSFAMASLLALALAACAAGPDHVSPAVPAVSAQPFVSAANPAFTTADTDGQWWRLYDDPVLDGLVEQALAHNTDLRAATANLRRVRAILRETRGARLPQTSIGAGATYGRAVEGAAPQGDRTGAAFDVGLDVAYEVDLFGRIDRTVEAVRSDAAAAEAERAAVRVVVAAETARAYADAAAAAEQLAIAEQSVALIEKTHAITNKRFEAGLGTRLDVARVAALRDRQRARLPDFRAGRDAALFRLAMLTGRAPAELEPAARRRETTLRLDQAIPVGDGQGLIARRPDVREAERRLAAETARIGVATADLYPRITFGAGVGSTSTALGDLFTGGPIRWLLGPLLSWSFPNQAVGRARIEQAEASAAGALAEFDGAVLRALQEAETALSAYANEIERRRALGEARGNAEAAARVTRIQLREGRADALSVLDAERTLAEADFELASSNARLTSLQIDLFRALGGGWHNDQSSPPGVTLGDEWG